MSSSTRSESSFFDKSKILHLDDIAPDFTADSTLGKISFHDYIKGSWTVFFSHCKSFTPVCTSELGLLAKLKDEFTKRGVKVIGLDVDDVETQKKWIKDVNDIYRCDFDFPLISDKDRKVSMLYNFLNKTSSDDSGPLPLRGLYIISPDLKIKTILLLPPEIGRNFDEVFRYIDGFNLVYKYKVQLPANWKKGEKVLAPMKVSESEVKKTFGGDLNKVRDYMILVNEPRM